ncbi:hypothetical protein BC834DRAFT_175831 [Gloeopeniophorella convolvens]|nr:hypothetical protein BC834DRAFT_175831 [Gloeopeniophorella convolvens]
MTRFNRFIVATLLVWGPAERVKQPQSSNASWGKRNEESSGGERDGTAALMSTRECRPMRVQHRVRKGASHVGVR